MGVERKAKFALHSTPNARQSKVWIDYDREADVLYLSFRKPQRATKTIETEDDLLIRKDGNKIVGITILNANTR